jgi:hypothetical protein
MAEDHRAQADPIHAMSACADRALALLERRRYKDLIVPLNELETRSRHLSKLRQLLMQGAPAPAGTRASCERLGQRLWVLSEVARQMAEIEAGLAGLWAPAGGRFYDRSGQAVEARTTGWEREA